MGNTPGKEVRSRSNSYGVTSNSPYASDGRTRRNTTLGFSDIRRSRKQEEKDRQLEYHYMKLIVKYTESVDGGYLAPFGIYKSNLDYNVDKVRELIINRRLAPFYTPLQDYDESWSDEELLIIVKQLTLHSIEGAYDEEEDDDDVDDHKIHKSSNFYKRQEQKQKLKLLIEKVKELQRLEEDNYFQIKEKDNKNKYLPSDELLLELYKTSVECPICFVYYPDNLNLCRCCLQPICTECFVQIKRLDPHPPHEETDEELPNTLISEPANCPYCAMTDFGVIFEKSVNFTTGIDGMYPGEYKTLSENDNEQAVLSSSPSSLESNPIKSITKHRRSSIPANSPKVVTIDQIRPDWETKLANARSKLARKAAAASAIHASNLIINPETEMPEYDTRRGRNPQASNSSASNTPTHDAIQTMEQRMLEEAMRLSILDEEERKRKEREKNNTT